MKYLLTVNFSGNQSEIATAIITRISSDTAHIESGSARILATFAHHYGGNFRCQFENNPFITPLIDPNDILKEIL